MNTRTYKAILFDLDGTLLDTINDIARCANQALTSLGYPTHAEERYKELVGDGLMNLARKILPEAHRHDDAVQRYVEQYRGVYTDGWKVTTTPYPGITETLAVLADRGVPLAVLSNKKHEFTQLCVSTYFPKTPFAEVRGEQAGTPIKPHPQAALSIAASMNVTPAECLFVGDSEIDIETAHAAGMTSVGVEWGFRPRAILEEARAHHIIVTPQEILEILSLK
jgi:phosphoglycolate phosphatase